MNVSKPMIVGALGAFLAMTIPAQARAAEALYDPPVGSRWTIHSQMREDDTRPGQSTTTIITHDADFSIVEKTDQGFRIAYAMRDFDVQGDTMQAKLSRLALNALRGVVVQATTDASGKPLSIENLPEVQAAFGKAMDAIVAPFADKPDVAAKMRAMIDAISRRDGDKSPDLLIEDLPLLAVAQNTHLALGQTREEAKLSPSPFGGQPFKTNLTLRLVDVDNDTGARRLIRTSAYDEAALRGFVVDAVAKLGMQGDSAKIEQMMRQMTLSNNGQTEFTVEHGMTRTVKDDTMLTVNAMGMTANKHQQTQITVAPAP
jgi:hypothetical protein